MRSQHREETNRLEQENGELKDTLNNLLDINNNLQEELQRIKILLEEHVADLADREEIVQQKDTLIE
jgi:regulator of replication initiation timing